MRWLQSIRDAQGKPYVLALAEGTRRMYDEMAALRLPAPIFEIGEGRTTLTLISNAPDREEALRQSGSTGTSTEFLNLFPLSWAGGGAESLARPPASEPWKRDLLEELRERLVVDGWYAEPVRKGRLTVHRRGQHVEAPQAILDVVRIYPAYEFQPREYGGRAYMCVDCRAVVQTVVPVARLLRLGIESGELLGLHAVAKWNETWLPGKITEVGSEFSRVYLFGPEDEERIQNAAIVPHLGRVLLNRVLATVQTPYDLQGEIRKAGLGVQSKAARTRSERTLHLVEHIASQIFPLAVAERNVVLAPEPATLINDPTGTTPLSFGTLKEPAAEFHDGRALPNIREGITKYGAYSHEPRDIEIVPVCLAPHRERMAGLIERLRKRRMRYQGSERTFSVRLRYGSIATTPNDDVRDEVARLLEHHPEWVGDERHSRVFLVHTPEEGYALDDETSPYYRIKRLLLESGIPCQMVDTPTLLNPDYKDLNLALNITAKVGVTPWVLPESIPDADFFIGLSYTASTRGSGQRLMGFVNVFNAYGRWEFYSGSAEPFPYEERAQSYERLIRQTLERLDHQLSDTPRVHFHYSARFSREDRDAILRAARSVRTRGTYSFVWVNSHHPVRLYDGRPEGDGSLARGSYVIGGPGQVYLSTTGFNPYRTVLGTPQALEVNARTAGPEGGGPSTDLRALAAQILSLTKLNWASTDSLCAEPITTKYAGDIAYLHAAFLRQDGPPFRLHPVLERTPWFI